MISNDFFRRVSLLRIPLVTQVEVTRRCNFRCPFCYLGEAVCIEIDKAVLMQTLEEIHSLGGMKVLFTGGEPLLYKPLLEVVRFAKKLGFVCELNTNGYILDNFDCSEISNLFASINISIHSNVPEEHDKIVGIQGAWHKVTNSILELRKQKANVFINTVVTEQETKRFSELKKFVEEDLGCAWTPDINIAPTYTNSYDAVNKYTAQMNSIEKIIGDETNRKLIIGEDSGVLCTGECKAARNLCFIDSQGYVYPCLSFKIAEDEKMRTTKESIAHKSFSEIWNNNCFIREVDMVTKDKFLECLECDLYTTCNKCIAENYLASGDFYIPSKTYCQKQHILHKK